MYHWFVTEVVRTIDSLGMYLNLKDLKQNFATHMTFY